MLCLLMALNLIAVQPDSYTVEDWYFEEQVSYGDQEDELLHTASQVIMSGHHYYILDSALSTVVELSDDGTYQEYSVEGEGPGECYQPNSLVFDSQGMLLLKVLPPTLVYTDLHKQQLPRDSARLEKAVFARNLLATKQDGYFLANTISNQSGKWLYTLSLIDGQGFRQADIITTPRESGDDFPIWCYRNSWAASSDKVAVITDGDYSVTVFDFYGEVKESIHGPNSLGTGEKNVLGGNLQGVFYLGDTLLILPAQSGDSLEFHLPQDKKIIRVKGVRASSQAQYFWLDKDTLAVMYGWAGRVFHTGSEETHTVTVFKRRKP